VTVLLRVGGADVLRSSFGVRPLPTLITGFVADQFYNAIEGVEVLLDGGAASAVTNHEGAFSFGFGTYAASIAGGRHLVTVNPGLKDRRYGTIVQWAFTHEGRPKDLGVIRAPLLGANEPFRRIASRSQSTPLLGGRLVLDLSQADLTFPDGAAAGDVHTQVLMGPSVGYRAQPVSIPFLTYVVQPMGVEVEGTIALDFDLPEEGGATYVDSLPELVLLSGLDPRALEIVPAGVGRVDKNSRRVRSEGRLALERLDFISITPLRSAAAQKALGDYVAGASDLSRLVAALQELR
jgi:hypothetical protein